MKYRVFFISQKILFHLIMSVKRKNKEHLHNEIILSLNAIYCLKFCPIHRLPIWLCNHNNKWKHVYVALHL